MDRSDSRNQRDTAITFNYDRPDNEPPQAMLLVISRVEYRHLGNGPIWSAH